MGGNLSLSHGVDAHRIDLNVHDRNTMAVFIRQLLYDINDDFTAKNGKQLWTPDLIKTGGFLSGSSEYFLNVDIPSEEFVKVKPAIGDIDVQVDIEIKPLFLSYLDQLFEPINDCVFLGYQFGTEQVSSLWKLADYGINLQIDFEFVKYSNNAPTDWSKFSHSSSWVDLQHGIKGVFHKFMIRALTSLKSSEMIVRKYTGKDKSKITDTKKVDNWYGFAVSSSEGGGLRPKYQLITYESDIPVVSQLPAINYEQDIEKIFRTILGDRFDESRINDVWSFCGLISIMRDILNPNEQVVIVEKFISMLYGKSAQKLYKKDPIKDSNDKDIVLSYLFSHLAIPVPEYVAQLRKTYIEAYK